MPYKGRGRAGAAFAGGTACVSPSWLSMAVSDICGLWLLRELDGERQTFLAEVDSNQAILLDDPSPAVPNGGSSKGRAPSRRRIDASRVLVVAWTAARPPAQWCRLSIRCGEKSHAIAECLTQPVWVWAGKSPSAQGWQLLVRRETGGAALKMCLYNAKTRASVRHLAEKQAARHFVESSFKHAKSASGVTDHQVRRCQVWHHQMARARIGRW